jgi:hypothetical protein
MKSLLTSVLLALISFQALAKDVTPQNGLTHGSPYVRVTKLANNRISFEECVAGYEKTTCVHLGNKKFYSMSQLQSQKSTEDCQILGAAAADLGLAVGAIFGGMWVAGTVAYAAIGTTAAGSTGMIIGGVSGAAIATTAGVVTDALNPHEQYKQAQTLDALVILDDAVKVDDIEVFIERLDTVLSKIE